MSGPLPRLLGRKELAAELGVSKTAAEAIMRRCPLIKVGRRIYVTDADASRAILRMREKVSE